MAEGFRTKIYISAMETCVSGKPVFDAQATQLLTRLVEEGYHVHWEKEHRDYEIIEQDIAASDALLAIVDETWYSSTWMASEVTWASGFGGAIPTSNPRMKPIPVFLYPVAGRLVNTSSWLGVLENHRVLERDFEKAVHQIRDVLLPKCATC